MAASVLPRLPASSPEPLPPVARGAVVLGVVATQVLAGWALLRMVPARAALGEVTTLSVEMIAPPAPAAVPAPPPPPPAPPKPVQRPRPVLSVNKPAAAPQEFVAQPAPAEPTPVVALAPAPPAPASALPAPPPAPRTLAITAVEYLAPPQLDYPLASRRLREQGRVRVRVLVGPGGAPLQMQLVQASGHARLDEAALATVRATRFKPYTENGVAQPFWVVMPLVFELEN